MKTIHDTIIGSLWGFDFRQKDIEVSYTVRTVCGMTIFLRCKPQKSTNLVYFYIRVKGNVSEEFSLLIYNCQKQVTFEGGNIILAKDFFSFMEDKVLAEEPSCILHRQKFYSMFEHDEPLIPLREKKKLPQKACFDSQGDETQF